MNRKGINKIAYLLQSHQPWQPFKVVVQSWEIGLTDRYEVDMVITLSTLDIEGMIEHDTK